MNIEEELPITMHVDNVGAILTENAQKDSLVDCQEDVPYTALTIV